MKKLPTEKWGKGSTYIKSPMKIGGLLDYDRNLTDTVKVPHLTDK